MTEQFLHELYVGKTKELEEIESLIGKARSKYMGKTYTGGRITFSDEFEKINRSFENLFGFSNFALALDNTSMVNAYTMPIAYSVDIAPQYRLKKNLTLSNGGFKYNKDAKYCCIVYITSGMFLNKDFTNGEILSMILHEIGHNFQSVLNDAHYYLTDIQSVFRALVIFIDEFSKYGPVVATTNTTEFITKSSNFVKTLDIKLSSMIAQIPGLSTVLGMIGVIRAIFKDMNINIFYVLNLLGKYSSLPITFVGSILSKILNPLGKSGEQVADSFATIYGYGPELSSAFNKISKKGYGIKAEDAIYKTPVIGTMVAGYNLPFEILLSAFDEHPAFLQRIQLVKANLTRELNDSNLDPKMRQKILEDLKNVEIAIKDYEKLSKSATYNPRAINAAWYVFISDYTNQEDKQKKVSEKIMGNIDRINANLKLR